MNTGPEHFTAPQESVARARKKADKILAFLKERGLTPPPGLVVDLTALTVDGPGILFSDRGRSPEGKARADFLNELASAAWVSKAIKQLRRLPHKARHQRIVERYSEELALLQFVEQILTRYPRFEVGGVGESEPELLGILGAAVEEHGAEKLDLELLGDCLALAPEEFRGGKAHEWRRARTRLPKGFRRRAHSPESGHHGLVRKGEPGALLRSQLARPDFVERWALKQLLYVKRFSEGRLPCRVSLRWEIERSPFMESRPPNQRLTRSGLALRIAAAQIEDAVHHLGSLPGLELSLSVLIHDGNPAAKRKEFLMAAPKEYLRRPRDETTPWLPLADAFFPYFFTRDPILPDQKRTQSGGRPKSPDWRDAELLHCCVMSSLRHPFTASGLLQTARREQARRANLVSVNVFAFDRDRIHWVSHPDPRGGADRSVPALSYQEATRPEGFRDQFWECLFQRLAQL